jgi:hypothetical protein
MGTFVDADGGITGGQFTVETQEFAVEIDQMR